MKLTTVILLHTLIIIAASFQTPIEKYFEKINHELTQFNGKAAELTWKSIVGSERVIDNATVLSEQWMLWHMKSCRWLGMVRGLNSTQVRQAYLLCRQPMLNAEEARQYENLYNDLQDMYFSVEICIPTQKSVLTKPTPKEIGNIIKDYIKTIEEDYVFNRNKPIDIVELAVKKAKENKLGVCIKGEAEFNKVKFNTNDEEVSKFIWLAWREGFGAMKEPWMKLVEVKNRAARRIGYHDLGSAWRSELEIPNLRQFCRELYEGVKPLYTLLHGVVRHYLRKVHGTVDEFGPIPAHLLGELWSQNWLSLSHLIMPENISLDQAIEKLKWNVTHMAKRAEDFYQSFGLPAMTEAFWRHSVFDAKGIRCHGSAADMFKSDDFRVIVCPDSPPTAFDFYVLHHEMGHIQYYMSYEYQPAIFRQGANSAFHESIGDTIMLGVYTPQHLNRLGIVNDTILYANPMNQIYWENIKIPSDMAILLNTALQVIPHIPFALLLEEYRWKVFEGNIEGMNEEFRALALELQGIVPPNVRGEEYFDAGAKYHVADDTPYIRYFLSNFIQFQLFEELCKVAIYGHRNIDEAIPGSIPLYRCDIYGSKAVGKLLKDFMSRGNSQKWQEILLRTTGKANISSDSIVKYFKPLQVVLEKFVRNHGVPLGW